MQRLFNIVQLFKEYFLLALLIIVSFILLSFNDNPQIREIRSYTIGFIGVLQDVVSVVPNVFELKRENAILRQLNVDLSDEVSRLREARLENLKLREMLSLHKQKEYRMIAGEVIGKNLNLMRNTITLNVGEADSVKRDMPIISEAGLVGKVIATSKHYSIGQLMLNKDFRASAKIQRSRVDGIIAWDGGDYILFKNISRTQDVKEGDLVTTSEYSSTFPERIKIGVVSKVTERQGSLFREVFVTPSVDFSSLEQVFVITALEDSERVALEKGTGKQK